MCFNGVGRVVCCQGFGSRHGFFPPSFPSIATLCHFSSMMRLCVSILSFPPFILSFPSIHSIISLHSFYHSLHSFLTLSQASPSVKWRRFISSSFSSKHTNSNKPTTTNNAPNLSIASNPLRSLSSCMSMRTMSNFPPPSITPSFWRESNVCSNKNNRS